MKTCFCKARQNLQEIRPQFFTFCVSYRLDESNKNKKHKTHVKERQDKTKTGEIAEINQDKVPTTSQDGDESYFEDLLQKTRSVVKEDISEQKNKLSKTITSSWII